MNTLDTAQAVVAFLRENPEARVYLAPIVHATSPSPVLLEVIVRLGPGETRRFRLAAETFEEAAAADPRLARFSPARPNAMGATSRPPELMGILNVTPDSFSDGGRYVDRAAALAHARRMMTEGAALIDIGGESTRPGAAPVAPSEEIDRVAPIIEALRGEAADRGVLLSIDTRHAATMRAALAAGARMINDVTALGGDPESVAVAASSSAQIVLMHMQGEPQTMQRAPYYDAAALDVYDALETRIAVCETAGIARARLVIDPGIGFGKSLQHNLDILRSLALYRMLGVPVLLGASRKSFIGALSRREPAGERLPGSLAAALIGAAAGVSILRVHDVAETAQALAVWRAVANVAEPG